MIEFTTSLVRTKVFDELNQADRAGAYQTAAQTLIDQRDRAHQLLTHLIDDHGAIFSRGGKKNVARMFPDLFRTVLIQNLKSAQPLPAGVWRVYKRVFGTMPLDSEECRLICAETIDTFRLEDFHAASLFNPNSKEDAAISLDCALHRIRAVTYRTPVEQVVLLSKLALRQPNDPLILESLFGALSDSGRLNEAALLDCWKPPYEARNDFSEILRATLHREAMLSMLIDAATGHVTRRALVRELITGDPLWLTESPTEVTILLFLARQINADDLITQLTFQAPDSLQEAKVEHPVLLEEWLEKRVRRGVTSFANTMTELTQLEAAWNQGLERKTVVDTGWPPGYQYQTVFTARLRKDAGVIDALHPTVTADQIFDEAQKTGLEAPRDASKRKMVEYLAQQLQRLARIRECKGIIDSGKSEQLSSLSDDALKKALTKERDRSRSTSPLRMVYDHALEQF